MILEILTAVVVVVVVVVVVAMVEDCMSGIWRDLPNT
jgi:hypothetical protein